MRFRSLFILALTATQHLCAQFYMSPPITIGTGVPPRSVACADFNQDGKADLAVCGDMAANNVKILLGVGTGSFVAGGTLTVGKEPGMIVTDDMNSDGKADLITTNGDSNQVAVALGNGNATFLPSVIYQVATNPSGLCVADFNLDGNPDVATSNYGSSNIGILLGSSSGTLSPPTYIQNSLGTVNITSADFNNDGKPDLAVIRDGVSMVDVFYGNGQGGFSAAGSFQVGWYPLSITTADFNEDGFVDIATCNYEDDNMSVLLSEGNGSFQTAQNYYVALNPYCIVTADFNNDGHADLAVDKNAANDSIVVFLGHGNGYFCKAFGYPITTFGQVMATGDFNNDGRTDVAVPTWGLYVMQIMLSKFHPLSITGDSLICGRGAVTLIAANNNSTYYWTGPAPDTSHIANGLTAIVHQGGTYTLHTPKDCVDTANFTVHADSLKAAFIASPTVGIPPEGVNFTSTSVASMAPLVNYSWNFGNGITLNGSSTTETTYASTGVYTVTLVITDSIGCKDSTTQDIRMIQVKVPNIFTPNGDNVNDEFFVKGDGLANIECSIYDRWGKKVHAWSGTSGGWNGRDDSGTSCVDGTYYYVVKYTDSSSRTLTQSGFIQLLR